MVSRSISPLAAKIAFWRRTRSLTRRSAVIQQAPIARMKMDRIIEAVITSIREKPCWRCEALFGEGMIFAQAFKPVENDRILARGGVAPVGRRGIAINHGATLTA